MSMQPKEDALRTPTDDEIPALLEAVAAAGGNIAAFAREHGLSAWKLYEARRAATAGGARGRERPGKAEGVFAPVRVVEEGAGPAEPLELIFADGDRLRIPVGFDEATLRRVLGVVTSC